jgi:hypothetical protein
MSLSGAFAIAPPSMALFFWMVVSRMVNGALEEL